MYIQTFIRIYHYFNLINYNGERMEGNKKLAVFIILTLHVQIIQIL